MSSISMSKKPHAVCMPYPAQGHINPMLKLAKLLHSHGFHITFINTDFNHRRLLKSQGPTALDGLPSFRFESIPDGLPPTDVDATQDIPSLCQSTRQHCLQPFRQLLSNLNSLPNCPPVSCIVSDGSMSFTLDAAEELGVPPVLFWTTSACGFLAYVHFRQLVQRGYTPFRDERYLNNKEYLETVIDWIPGMKGIRLKDMPSFIRTTDPDDGMMNYLISEIKRAERASAIVLNTIASLEQESLNALSSLLPPDVFSIGPLQLLHDQQILDPHLKLLGSNLWKEDRECLHWLDHKPPNSVAYLNFGSITVMTKEQLNEFAWGLANSGQTFLWVIRPDMVAEDTEALSSDFMEATKERGMLLKWCPQEEVLKHPAIGGFLTHNGWNSTLESIVAGVPMVCWPFFAEQQTNCRYCCTEWGIGMEIDGNVKREDIQMQVKELMVGEKGKEMRKKAQEWKILAAESAADGGSSRRNIDMLISKLLLQSP